MGEKVTSWKFFLSMSADFSAQIINAIFHPFNYKVFATLLLLQISKRLEIKFQALETKILSA